MTIEQARGIAARLWCDPEMHHVTMDVHIAESIANLILKLDAQERTQ